MLEWLSDAEMQLRFQGHIADDEDELVKQLEEHKVNI